MPRQSRIEAPGALHNIIIRGIGSPFSIGLAASCWKAPHPAMAERNRSAAIGRKSCRAFWSGNRRPQIRKQRLRHRESTYGSLLCGSVSAWDNLRFHCKGVRCQPVSREQSNNPWAEVFGTRGYRGNIVGKSINQGCPLIVPCSSDKKRGPTC